MFLLISVSRLLITGHHIMITEGELLSRLCDRMILCSEDFLRKSSDIVHLGHHREMHFSVLLQKPIMRLDSV